MYRLFLILFLMVSFAMPVQAQDAVDSDVDPFSALEDREQTPQEIFFLLPPEVQEQILEEASDTETECVEGYLYSRFHDCECMGPKYIELRVINPEMAPANIRDELSALCPNVPGIAGEAFENCRSISTDRNDIEEYCGCFANYVARRYRERPIAHMEVFRQYSRDAFIHCSERFD